MFMRLNAGVRKPGDGELQREDGAVTSRLVGCGYAAADRLHRLARERQTQACSARSLGAKEWLKNSLQILGRDTNSLRSEEHTSELQSHLNLVCRLLLEKKKTRN